MANELLRYAGGVEPPMPALADELELRALWRTLWRRKGLVALVAILGVLGALAFVAISTPLYEAVTLVRLQAEPAIGELAELTTRPGADPATVAGEIELMRSPAFVGDVVDRYRLSEDPALDAELRPAPWAAFWSGIDRLAALPSARRPVLSPAGPADDAPLEHDRMIRARTVETLRARLTVEQVERSNVIEIRARAEDPLKAAHLADAVAERYVARRLAGRQEAARRAADWLSERVDQLRVELGRAEQRLLAQRSARGLAGERRVDAVAQQVGELNGQLALAQAGRAEAEARLEQARAVLRGAGGAAAAAAVLGSPLLNELRAQESRLQRELTELAGQLGERHPRIQDTRAQLKSVRDAMLEEGRRLVAQLGNEVEVARAREGELRRHLDRLEGRIETQVRGAVALNDLEREVAAARELYEAFLRRLAAVNEARYLEHADAAVLAGASVPTEPVWPSRPLVLILALGGGGFLGVVLAFVLDRWGAPAGFRTLEEVRRTLGLTGLALVPAVRRRARRGRSMEAYLLERPTSAFAESVQRLRARLLLGSGTSPVGTVLVTSSLPAEGKSTLACALARQSARAGLRVLLIDADLRRPGLHRRLGFGNEAGLAEILAGELELATALRHDEATGLAVVTAGQPSASPPDLLRSPAMRRLLERATNAFDLVVLDSPPVLAVADAAVLTPLADRTVYVVGWERTPREVVKAGLEQLAEAGAALIGVVLSHVDEKRLARYDPDHARYAAERCRHYYLN